MKKISCGITIDNLKVEKLEWYRNRCSRYDACSKEENTSITIVYATH